MKSVKLGYLCREGLDEAHEVGFHLRLLVGDAVHVHVEVGSHVEVREAVVREGRSGSCDVGLLEDCCCQVTMV